MSLNILEIIYNTLYNVDASKLFLHGRMYKYFGEKSTPEKRKNCMKVNFIIKIFVPLVRRKIGENSGIKIISVYCTGLYVFGKSYSVKNCLPVNKKIMIICIIEF